MTFSSKAKGLCPRKAERPAKLERITKVNEKHRKGNRNEEATAFLEGYLTACKEMEVPLKLVAIRLGEILQQKRQRRSYSVPKLPEDSKRTLPRGKALPEVESNGSAHRGAQAKLKKIKKLPFSERLALAMAGKLFTKAGKKVSLKLLRSQRANAAKARAAYSAKIAAKKEAAA